MERSIPVFPLSVDVGIGFGEETDAVGAGTFGVIDAVSIGGGEQEAVSTYWFLSSSFGW